MANTSTLYRALESLIQYKPHNRPVRGWLFTVGRFEAYRAMFATSHARLGGTHWPRTMARAGLYQPKTATLYGVTMKVMA